jgi:hypothetical protein
MKSLTNYWRCTLPAGIIALAEKSDAFANSMPLFGFCGIRFKNQIFV